jgi:hypothetical protein
MTIGFDPNAYEPKTFETIPVGRHRVRIEEITEKVSKTSGKDMVEIKLQVSGYSSRLFIYIVENEYANQNIGQILESTDMMDTIRQEGFHWSKLKGQIGGVQVKHENYEGEPRAKVAYWLSRDKVDDLPDWTEKRINVNDVEDPDVPF